MRVGDSVRKAIKDWEEKDVESAMLHACNAIDGTAKKIYPKLGNKKRFTQFLRDNYQILGPMGTPGIDIVNTRFPVKINRPTAPDGKPDLADLIYGIHRCTHGHGDELPDGFELLADAAGSDELTHSFIEKGRVRLSDRIIFGLLAVAVVSPVNQDQKVPDGYHFKYYRESRYEIYEINNLWGKRSEFIQILSQYPLPQIKLDFGDWME